MFADPVSRFAAVSQRPSEWVEKAAKKRRRKKTRVMFSDYPHELLPR